VGFSDSIAGIEGFRVQIVDRNLSALHVEEWFPAQAQNTSVTVSAGDNPLVVSPLVDGKSLVH
jgi:hypothetical protein